MQLRRFFSPWRFCFHFSLLSSALTVPALAQAPQSCQYGPYQVLAASGNGYSSNIVSDRNGNVLLYLAPGPILPDGWVLHYRQGIGWQSAGNLHFQHSFASYFAPLAMDEQGNAMIVWKQCLFGPCGNPGVGQFIFSTWSEANGWSAPAEIMPTAFPVQDADLVMTGNGHASLVFETMDYAAGVWSLQQVDYDPLIGWLAPVTLLTVSQPYYYPVYAQIAADASGVKCVTYTVGPDAQNHYTLFARVFDPQTGAWLPAQTLTSALPWQLFKWKMLFDRQGRATVVFPQESAPSLIELQARSTPDLRTRRFGMPQALQSAISSVTDFEAAVNVHGNLAVSIVQDFDGDSARDLYARTFDVSTQSWSSPMLAEKRPAPVDPQHSLVFDDNGSVRLLFPVAPFFGSQLRLVSANYDPSNLPGQFLPATVVGDASDWSYMPQTVALDGNGALFSTFHHTYSSPNLFAIDWMTCE